MNVVRIIFGIIYLLGAGFNVFFVVPEGITMGDIYRSIVPFVGVQAIGMILIIIFPQIALWLPGVLITRWVV